MQAQQSKLNIKYEVKISILMNALLIGLLISLKYDTIAVKREQMYLTIWIFLEFYKVHTNCKRKNLTADQYFMEQFPLFAFVKKYKKMEISKWTTILEWQTVALSESQQI